MHTDWIARGCRYSIPPQPWSYEAIWHCKAFPDGIPRDWPCMSNLMGTLAVKPCKVPRKCPNSCCFELSENGREILISLWEWYYPDGIVHEWEDGDTREQLEKRIERYMHPSVK